MRWLAMVVVWTCAFAEGGWVLALCACGSSSSQHGQDAAADSRSSDAPLAMFAPKVDFATGPNPTFVALVDIDGDGKLDIVAPNTNGSAISILLGSTPAGATTPTFATHAEFPTGSAPACVAVGDFNDDGKPDLATANVGASTVTILLNTTVSAPSFSTGEFAVGANPEFVAVADLDGDGKADFATANVGAGTVSVSVNTTTALSSTPGFATAVDHSAGAGAVAIVAGDVDGDGKQDLAVANLNASSLSTLLNTTVSAGSPTFAPAYNSTTGSKPSGLAFHDLDGDGKADFAVADSTGHISLFRNTTVPSAAIPALATAVVVPTGSEPDGLAVADLDGDGRADLVTADFGSNQVSWVRATSYPSYAAALDFTVGAMPRAVAVGDINGDGKPDVVVANGGSNTVSVLLAR